MSKIHPSVSIIVPLYNEEENVKILHQSLTTVLSSLPNKWEIIFIDDGSSDYTYQKCLELKPLRLIKLRKNFGQTAAFDAGFKNAVGDVFITMDGDLQNDPNDIPKFIEKIEQGYDVVSGWRKNRKDSFSKKITSRIANLLRKFLFKDSIHDSGCALKAYRKECFNYLDLYGEMHRFIPALLDAQGFKITEIIVNHKPRIFGVSKYGNLKRGFKSFIDMISIWFWSKYSGRPLHIFGGIGILLIIAGSLLLFWLFVSRLFFDVSLANKIWPLIGVSFIIAGIQFFTIGIFTDLLSKTYYKSHNKMNYFIEKIYDN